MATTGRDPQAPDDAANETDAGGTDERPADGRRLRRDRNRDAVVRALLELYNEGNLAPSTEEIATRSGVSARSLFRYFDDSDDLSQAAIAQQQENVRHLLPLTATPDDALDDRVRALVHQRGELFEAIESIATVSRLRAPFQLVVADRLTEGRAFLRRQVEALFAHELAALPADEAATRLAAADVATSFEAWRLLRDDLRLTRPKAAEAMATTITALFRQPDSTRHEEPHR
jgi:TetR/AcrR family transcriptional regulator of autoinduction and epiphytic fitness